MYDVQVRYMSVHVTVRLHPKVSHRYKHASHNQTVRHAQNQTVRHSQNQTVRHSQFYNEVYFGKIMKDDSH